MMATLLELTHAHVRLVQAQLTGKQPVKPLVIPRPQRAGAARAAVERAPDAAVRSVREFNVAALQRALGS